MSAKSILTATVLLCTTSACSHLNLSAPRTTESTTTIIHHTEVVCETPVDSQLAAACFYPDPARVLALQQALSLTPTQLKQTQTIYAEMTRYAEGLQTQLDNKRQQLDSQFESQQINDDKLASLLTEISIVESKLRYVYLGAYIKQFKLLTAQQRASYRRIQESFLNR